MNRINAPDGTPLVFDSYVPSGSAPTGAVLVLHDWGGDGSQWVETGARLRDEGFATYVLDQRGHGRSGGSRAHLSRFSQLLGDLQAFRRAVRRERDVPQMLCGQGFGALVVLRYLETQPADAPAGAIVSGPWLASRKRPAIWKRVAAKFADLWPSLPTGSGGERMTAGARAEIQWAQRAVMADAQRIESRLLFLLGGEDRVADAPLARSFAEGLSPRPQVRWYPEKPHQLFGDDSVFRELVAFLRASQSLGRAKKGE